MVDAMDIELAAIPREFPQFGKSLYNLVRSRSQVFPVSEHGGEGKSGHVCRGKCGCGSKSSRDLERHDRWLMDDEECGHESCAVPVTNCCASIYCDMPAIGRNVHCYFYMSDCESSYMLELNPLKVAGGAQPFGGPDSIMVLTPNAQLPKANPLVEVCEPCVMCHGEDQSSCSLADCLLSAALAYPLAHPDPSEPPVATNVGGQVTLNPAALGAMAFGRPTYNAAGPNSNTFVAILARACGLPVPPLKVPGGIATGIDWTDRKLSLYVDRNKDYVDDLRKR